MKKSYLTLFILIGISLHSFGQTNVQVDANDVVTSNSKLVIQTSAGQSFFTGHQAGGGYAYGNGIFRAITDNPTFGNYFFDGLKWDGSSAYTTTYSVRSDGTGYFANGIGIGIPNPQDFLHIFAGTANSLTTAARLSGGDGGPNAGTSLLFTSAYSDGSWLTGRIGALSSGYGIDYGSSLVFQTNSGPSVATLTEKMRIDKNGNVGIGTTTPGNKLDVSGSAIFNPSTTAGYYTEGIRINNAPNNFAILHLGGNAGSTFSTGSGQWTVLKDYYNHFGIWENGNPMFSILNTTGNVGVSTTDPISSFQVQDGCTKASIGEADGQDLNFGTSYLGFNAARSSSRQWTVSNDSQHNGGGVIYSNILGEIYFAPIASTGTTDQTLSDTDIKNKITFRVSADGTTYAKKIKVELTGWPDYVFKPTYTLMPLTDVKSYIDKNHHLPDMPSAEKVEKEGLDLGEMNKLLTKKVEELTLYLIEKDKKEKEQEQNTESLENKVKIQDSRIDKLEKQLESLLKLIPQQKN